MTTPAAPDQTAPSAQPSAPGTTTSTAPAAAGVRVSERQETTGEAFARIQAALGSSDVQSDGAAPAPSGRGPDGKFLPGKGRGPAAKAAPEAPTKGEVRAAVAAEGDPAKREQLVALARELGYDLEDGTVSRTERVELRRAMKRKAARLQEQEAAIASKYEQTIAGVKDRLSREEALQRAWEDRDHEALAKALGAKDWDEVQSELIAKVADPNWKRLRENEQRLARIEREKEEALQREEASRDAALRAEAEGQLRSAWSQSMRDSDDPVLSALHDDPILLNTLRAMQEENLEWDADGNPVVLDPVKAVRMSRRGDTRTVVEHLRAQAERFARAFPDLFAAAPAAAPSGGTARRPAPRSAPVPTRPAAAPDAPRFRTKDGRHDDRQFSAYAHQRLLESLSSAPPPKAAGRR